MAEPLRLQMRFMSLIHVSTSSASPPRVSLTHSGRHVCFSEVVTLFRKSHDQGSVALDSFPGLREKWLTRYLRLSEGRDSGRGHDSSDNNFLILFCRMKVLSFSTVKVYHETINHILAEYIGFVQSREFSMTVYSFSKEFPSRELRPVRD